MSAAAVMRNEGRILRRDPVPAIVLVAMPIVLMTLLAPALALALAAEGRSGTSGGDQAVPGMISVFTFFGVAFVGFALFREHGWRTWPRLRAVGLTPRQLLAGKVALPAAMLVAQHVVLFAYGTAFLDLTVTGSWAALVLVSLALIAMVVALGLLAAAALQTIQQLNAVTNLGAMVLGGLGGGFVPVSTLPGWVQPLAPASPAYWAMRGYRAVILDGGGPAEVALPVGIMVAVAVVAAALAVVALRDDAPKRTWG